MGILSWCRVFGTISSEVVEERKSRSKSILIEGCPSYDLVDSPAEQPLGEDNSAKITKSKKSIKMSQHKKGTLGIGQQLEPQSPQGSYGWKEDFHQWRFLQKMLRTLSTTTSFVLDAVLKTITTVSYKKWLWWSDVIPRQRRREYARGMQLPNQVRGEVQRKIL